LQNILFEVERYKRQTCQDSDLVYYTRLKELQHEEDWVIKQKMTVVNGFWRETIFLWNKVTPSHYSLVLLVVLENQNAVSTCFNSELHL